MSLSVIFNATLSFHNRLQGRSWYEIVAAEESQVAGMIVIVDVIVGCCWLVLRCFLSEGLSIVFCHRKSVK